MEAVNFPSDPKKFALVLFADEPGDSQPHDFRNDRKLPNAERATVPEAKITLYLLNPGHHAGGSKAAFFLRFGFTVELWQQFGWALRRHAMDNEVALSEETKYGMRFVVDGPLVAATGDVLNVRASWFINPGADVPRFVTAHPLPKL